MSAAGRKAVRPKEHTNRLVAPRAVGCAILTVSDTRRGDDDRSGARMHELLEKAGHVVTRRAWARDERRAIRAAVSVMNSPQALKYDTPSSILPRGDVISQPRQP